MTASKFLWAATASIAVAGCMSAASSADARDKRKAQNTQPQSISAADRQEGAKNHPKLMEQFGGSYDSPQAAYARRIGQDIAVQSGLGNARSDFTVTLLNSPVNNAFAIPGGYVYLTRQLMALMNDEAEMAGVLGHEVGHVAAQHGRKRQKTAKRNSILGMLGQIGAAVLLGDSTAGKLGQRIFGTGSQLLTLSFSRKQEYEADDLGIRYLQSAGYDPQALSTMLASLAAQSSIDARVAGRDARSAPEWASTHPDPARRVNRAAVNARKYTANGGKRNREVFLRNINGMRYGDDPKQGIVDGNVFRHPTLRLSFSVPRGFNMQNGSQKISISGTGGQAEFRGDSYRGDLNKYVLNAFQKIGQKSQGQQSGQGLRPGQVQYTRINGLPVAYSTAQTKQGNKWVDVTVFAYEFSKKSAYHFVTLAPSGQGQMFNSMYGSVRRLSTKEANAIKFRKIRVATVGPRDTIRTLASKMAYDDLKLERFLALNRLRSNDQLRSGQKVKLVVY